MKRLIALLLCVFGLLAAPLRADVELSFDFYYDQLSPMGEWVEVDGYGYVWHPSGVDEDWAPYIDGYWTYTDAGWTWVSYEDWGAICYHYGRWVHLIDYGWCWVPGYEWGPAWVSWRHSDDYIGWAPLPPECDWEADRGISIWVDTHYDIGPRWYSFCRVSDFGAPVLRHVLLPRFRNVDICFTTINITNITYNRDYGCVYNGGFDYDYIRSRSSRPVPALKLVRNTTNIFINNNGGNVLVNSPRGNALVVAAPKVAANAKNFTRKPAVRRTFKRDAVTRGWAGLEKPEMRDRLTSKMREETKGLGPANAKARPVKPEALAAVPKEVKLDAQPAGFRRLPAERPTRATATREEPAERPAGAGRDGRIEKMRPNGRGETAEAPGAGTDDGKAGLRKRSDTQTPAVTVRPQPGTETPAQPRGKDFGKPERMITPQERPAGRGQIVEQEDRSKEKLEKPTRLAEPRTAQENARQQAQDAAEKAAAANSAAANAAAARERMARDDDAREGQARDREQADAARAAAERVQRQREAADTAGRAAEMRRQAQENAGRENAARENAARDNALRQQAAEVAAARRAQMEAQKAQQSRASEQAEAAQRQAVQRAAENARREAAERQSENARRQLQERPNDNGRQQAMQRQAEAQRERAAAQQNDARQRAAEAARSRAMDAQRQQAAEINRARAMENQQRAAGQAQAQARAEAQRGMQQRAAEAAAARRQPAARPQPQEDDRRKRKGN